MRRSQVLAVLAATLSACGNAPIGVPAMEKPKTETPEPPGAELSGRWAMFQWEDPVAVELQQDGSSLRGIGCGAGLPASDSLDASHDSLCGEVTGSIVGLHATFAFGTLGGFHYEFDVFVSSDGQRMGGRLRTSSTVPDAWASGFAWLRIGGNDRWLEDPATPMLSEAFRAREGSFGLTPVGAPPTDLAPPADAPWFTLDDQRTGALLSGSLGSFSPREMTWDEATQTLIAGPVPATSPTLPIKLSLTFDGKTLLGAEATMPSGAVHQFTGRR